MDKWKNCYLQGMQLWRTAATTRNVRYSRKEMGKKPPTPRITVSFLWLLLAKPSGKPEDKNE